MPEENQERSLCGLWSDPEGMIHLCYDKNGERVCESDAFRPFLWANGHIEAPDEAVDSDKLGGELSFNMLHRFKTHEDYKKWSATKDKSVESTTIKPIDDAWLLHSQERLFRELKYGDIRCCQLDIETCVGDGTSFPDPKRKDDRVIAIGLRFNGKSEYLELLDYTDEAERELLIAFSDKLSELDPDIIQGHNIHKFDLNFLHHRCKRLKLPCNWGRFGANAQFRNSRLRIAERWLDFPRCDIPGRTVCDTFFMIMMYDVSTRDLPSYSLKDVALYFGISKKEDRTYLSPKAIHESFDKNREAFRAYLDDDLRETEGIADLLLPTYIAQARTFPMSLQEILLRGTGTKVESLFLEKYYHAKHSIPAPQDIGHFEGAFSKSFVQGIYPNVLHFDVASLYPSLLLQIDRNPYNDPLGIFIPLLKELKEYRIRYKKLAQDTEDAQLQQEYQARQSAFKIIINSFYGYLGFGGARFADGELAAKVTERGRELLQSLISEFQKIGCTVLEADTDGIYLSSEEYFGEPEALLDKAASSLPKGISLEYDGSYKTMFCYKAKNYALYDGEKVTIRGSALRSRGTEPYLKELTDTLIHNLLGATDLKPADKIKDTKELIESGKMPIEKLARKEYLSQNPDKYREAVEQGKKSRRASLEAALISEKPYKTGEQVAYYVTAGEKKRMPEWQNARPLENYDPESAPYNADHYLRKIKDWEKRYTDFLENESEQGELF